MDLCTDSHPWSWRLGRERKDEIMDTNDWTELPRQTGWAQAELFFFFASRSYKNHLNHMGTFISRFFKHDQLVGHLSRRSWKTLLGRGMSGKQCLAGCHHNLAPRDGPMDGWMEHPLLSTTYNFIQRSTTRTLISMKINKCNFPIDFCTGS